MTMASSVGARPERMSITNLVTGDALEVQRNPTELAEALGVNWQKSTVPGLAHQPLHYIHTNNHKPSFQLVFDSLLDDGSRYDIDYARRFLLHLCYPTRGAQTITRHAPPRVLFVWPQLFALTTLIADVQIQHVRFALSGAPTRYTAQVTLEEVRDLRLYGDDLLADGTRRGGNGQGER